MRDGSRKSSARWVIGVLFLGIAGTAFLGMWLRGRAEWRMAVNERNAQTWIKTLVVAETEFRKHDRDGNGVHDFWTADVSGLHTFGLIDQGLAKADPHPLKALVAVPVPRDGYFFVALNADESATPAEEYRKETDTKSGKVHHLSKFAFLAYPADSSEGRYMFIVNENCTILRTRADRPRPENWPPDHVLNSWSKFQ